MKRLLVLVGLLLVPIGLAEGTDVHNEWVIPHSVALGGLGGGLFQGDSHVFVTYDALMVDNDRSDHSNQATGLLSVNGFGPGTDLAADVLTVTVESHTCSSVTSIHSFSSVTPGTATAAETFRVALDETSENPEKCDVVVSIRRPGDLAFDVLATAQFVNPDQPPEAFFELTAMTPAQFLVLIPGLALVGVFLWTRNDHAVQLFGVVLVGVDIALLFGHAAISQTWRMQTSIGLLMLALFVYMLVAIFRDLIKRSGGGPI